jgi:hypothetical protein
MPTFMDVHEGMHVTPQQLVEAHKKDLEAQKGTGVEYVRYWLDSKAGKVFCLATGPNKEAVAAVHKTAGHPANEPLRGHRGPVGQSPDAMRRAFSRRTLCPGAGASDATRRRL